MTSSHDEGPLADAEWVLARGLVGWIPDPALRAARTLEEEVAELEARRCALGEAVDEAIRAGREEGFGAVRAELDALVAELGAAREALVRRAAGAALVAARELVHGAVAADPEGVVARVRALCEDASGRRPDRVLVSNAAVRVVQHALGEDITVAVDAGLEPGDAVVEFPDGKREWRLADVLARWSADITGYVRSGDG